MTIFIADIQKNTATLAPEESWHCAKVLRKKIGDHVHVIDGKGLIAEGTLSLVSEKKCSVHLLQEARLQDKHPYYLHLAIAPTKQIDRMEWLLEKAVEIGIDEISFIQCKNSERVQLKNERIQKIVESAVKQSLQAYIPKINALTGFDTFIQNCTADQLLLAHCYNANKTPLISLDFKNIHSLVMIGPEGDFSREEVKAATEKKIRFVSLGENRLRTETAGLFVCMSAAIRSRL
jgi:16S rRNA (uracil1498-N3)-methyltransferase